MKPALARLLQTGVRNGDFSVFLQYKNPSIRTLLPELRCLNVTLFEKSTCGPRCGGINGINFCKCHVYHD